MQLIELRDIYKTYHVDELPVPVLRGVSLAVAKGELVALMGASGSGKSTLMNILGCLDRPTSGEYWFEGREVARMSADQRAFLRNHKIGFVFQSFNLLPRTSALDNVIMPLSYTAEKISDSQARQRAVESLVQMGLGDRLNYEPSKLSGGQQQRVAIARSLVNRPSILLADEPTGNLDSHTSEEVLQLFDKLNKEQGITIILVTHDFNIARHAKRIIHISDGAINGRLPDEIYSGGSRPRNSPPEIQRPNLGGLR
jgi:ABC-type lipoprotein export system ATPase subunit